MSSDVPLPEELLDGADDGVLVADLARHDALVLAEVLAQVLDELARAVRALDLAVANMFTRGRSFFFRSSTQSSVSSIDQLSPSEKWNG
jgi:hypothetical protein